MIEIKKKTASLISRSQQLQTVEKKRYSPFIVFFFFFFLTWATARITCKASSTLRALISGIRLNKIILLVIYTVLGFNALLVCVVPKNRIKKRSSPLLIKCTKNKKQTNKQTSNGDDNDNKTLTSDT